METLKLKNEERIIALENCPSKANLDGVLTLYRCVASPINEDSFIPHSLLFTKFINECNAWGLSLFLDVKSARLQLKNLTKKMQGKYLAIAKCCISNSDGIKYQSGQNKFHYTFFPKENFDCVANFILIDEDE